MARGPSVGVFTGMAPAALQEALNSAQLALITLESGQMVATVSYAQGEGNRSVTYTRADSFRLRKLIEDLQAALGMRSRNAIGVSFA